MTTNHTPEPWHVSTDGYAVSIPRGHGETTVADCFDAGRDEFPATRQANARRIVACVNACEGIGTETLEKERSYVRGHKGLLDERNRLREINAELLAALRKIEVGHVRAPAGTHRDALNRCKELSRAALAKAESWKP